MVAEVQTPERKEFGIAVFAGILSAKDKIDEVTTGQRLILDSEDPLTHSAYRLGEG